MMLLLGFAFELLLGFADAIVAILCWSRLNGDLAACVEPPPDGSERR